MKLTWRRQPLKTKYPFSTSKWTVENKETIILEIEHEGTVGLGEVVPSILYGQTLESSEAALQALAPLLGDDPFAIDSIVRRLIEHYDDQRAVIAGIDSALYDSVGKRLRTPVWRLLGLDQPRKQTTFTLGVAPLEQMRIKLDEALADGFDALKVKVGVEDDQKTLDLIRSRFDGPLLMDANQAWSVSDAARHIRGLARYRPSMIEQPLRREDWKHLRELRELGVAPIFADESCERPADVVRLHGYVDGINIKFNKCGGIREALRMVTLARELGMAVMLGCFVSSCLAIAPALTIASLVDYADLDGHLLLATDPYQGVSRDGSILSLPDEPGLGVSKRA